MKKILITTIPNMIDETDLKELKKIAEVDILINDAITPKELAEISKNYDCLMLNYDIVKTLDDSFYKSLKNSKLKAISTDITGMTWASPQSAKQNGITLMNTPNYCTESVAEFTIAQILLYARQIHNSYLDLINKKEQEERKGFDLKGKIIGIVGLGNIGMRVAEIALAFGMNVIAYNRTPKKLKNIKMVSLETIFREADIISPHLKCVEGQTEKIINMDLLKLCKPSCFIANQGGEGLVNLADIEIALKDKIISGYSGTYKESTKHLSKYENVILQPPMAWFSDESLHSLRSIWVNNIINFLNEVPSNIIEE